MGIYLNPGNSGFAEVIRGKYVDKTGMIELMNERIGRPGKLVCVSRPRRFGKSYAAKMLCAYYDCSCRSEELFQNYEIAGKPDYREHLNHYNVIYLDMSQIVEESEGKNPAEYIKENILKEITETYAGVRSDISFSAALIDVVEKSGHPIIAVIDEWDAPIRERPEYEDAYLKFLRTLFKSSATTSRIFAAAYMTGILPIKKDGSQSAISDFKEYTILNPGPFTEYTGFTADEVKKLCLACDMDYDQMEEWYDGYQFDRVGSIYNPYSVMETVDSGEFESHWQKTSAAENLITYINLDFEGLQADILKMMAGEPLRVNTRGFRNDFENFKTKDDVLTLLMHLGYLAYDKKTGTARIPNEEVRLEYKDILETSKYTRLAALVRASEQLLSDTIAGREVAVAKAIEKVRETNYAPQYYNDEQALRYAIKFAYIVCVDRFMKVEEMPGGRGLADLVFIPYRDTAYPAIIIELKWNKDPESALDQIREKKYASVLEGYTGDIIKVGISYSSDSKIHSCKIEKVRKR